MIIKTQEEEIADQATGCNANPHGLGKLYAGPINRGGMVSDPGYELTNLEEIQDYLFEGGSVGIPNAGAGSYRRAFEAMGFTDLEVISNGSSAGDWSFAVYDGMYWKPAFQENRYPRHGFSYSVGTETFEAKKDCIDYMCRW